jgi:hypothetical protein
VPKYRVCFTVDATVDVVVEAKTPLEAQRLAWNNVSAPCLCHQCSDEVEIGDIQDLISVEEAS